MSTEENNSRIFYLDYLRLYIVVLVVFLHALLPHVKDYEWYINSSQINSLFTILALHIDVFIMPIMFFVAGYFTYPSLAKRGIKSFLYAKVKRILLPFIAGLTLFSPIMSYIGVLAAADSAPSYINFWSTMYFSDFLKPAHYWFLSSLFFFYLTFIVIYYFYQEQLKSFYDKSIESITKKKLLLSLLLFFIVGILLFFIVNVFKADAGWISLFNIFSLQPTRWTTYVLYFYLGIFAYLNRIKIKEAVLEKLPLLTFLTLVISIAYLGFKIAFIAQIPGSMLLKFVNAALHFSLCFFVFLLLMVFFKKYLNKPSRLLSRLAAQSYRIYFVHMVIVVILQYFLFGMGLSVYAKFFVVFTSSLVLSYLFSEIYAKGYQVLGNFD